jgi:hypothetical protein
VLERGRNMKKPIYLTSLILWILIFITSCSKSTIEQKDNMLPLLQKELEEKQILTLEQKILQLNSVISNLQEEHQPTVYDKNNFEPKKIKVGDSIIGLTVSRVWLGWDGHEDSFIIDFSGQVQLSGTLVNHPNDGYYTGLEFVVDEKSLEKIPVPLESNLKVSHFLIGNSNFIERITGTKESEMYATVVLSDVVIGSSKDKPWENTANIIQIVNMD